ncbi:MAG TPA: FixH family protein [Vicinamibacterales bacterium]
MKRLSILIASLVVSGALVFAHEGNEHVRGVVTAVSPQSITVQTTDKKTTTLRVTAKTTFQLAGKAAHLADLKVGDRVVVDVPEKSSDALLVQIGTAPAAAQTSAKAAPAKKLDIAFTSSPKPTKIGNNTFEVTVKDAAGKPVTDADVSVLLTMPAMPAMKMPAMRNEVKLKHAGAGKYTGSGQVMAKGMWTVTVSAKQNGAEAGQKKLTLTAN